MFLCEKVTTTVFGVFGLSPKFRPRATKVYRALYAYVAYDFTLLPSLKTLVVTFSVFWC